MRHLAGKLGEKLPVHVIRMLMGIPFLLLQAKGGNDKDCEVFSKKGDPICEKKKGDSWCG